MQTYSSHLKQIKDHIWIPKIKRRVKTAYPSDGHSSCFGIEDFSFWFRHRNNCIMAIVKTYPPPGVIFDIGGGNGYVTAFLCENGFKCILVEPSDIGIRNALSRAVPQVIATTFEEAQFKKNSIPAVGLFDVLEHMEDDRKFLRQLYGYLVPNGKIYMTVPTYPLLWSAQDIYAHHFRRYTLKDIKILLKSLNFQIDYTTYFFTILLLPLFLFRTIPYLMKLSKVYTTEQFQKEMTPATTLFSPALNFLLKWELNKIKTRKSLPFGSSIIIAAHKLL